MIVHFSYLSNDELSSLPHNCSKLLLLSSSGLNDVVALSEDVRLKFITLPNSSVLNDCLLPLIILMYVMKTFMLCSVCNDIIAAGLADQDKITIRITCLFAYCIHCLCSSSVGNGMRVSKESLPINNCVIWKRQLLS